jgi:hypothetical protein
MGRKAKRLRILKRIERLSTQVSQPSPIVENSVMQEKLKQETAPTPVVETAPELVVEPTPEPTPIAEEMVKEMEQLIAEVRAPPKLKPKPRKRRTPTRRKKKAEE